MRQQPPGIFRAIQDDPFSTWGALDYTQHGRKFGENKRAGSHLLQNLLLHDSFLN
jgi:hypothetical protein